MNKLITSCKYHMSQGPNQTGCNIHVHLIARSTYIETMQHR